MRKITQLAKQAFEQGDTFKRDNTEVRVSQGWVDLVLHGHTIAQRKIFEHDKVYFSLCGFPTPTTRERLKAAGVNIYQHQGSQFIHGCSDESNCNEVDETGVYFKDTSFNFGRHYK